MQVDWTDLNELELLITSIYLFCYGLNNLIRVMKAVVPNSSIAGKEGRKLHDLDSLVAAVVSAFL